jgi:FMN phosphatase YigB (HAD superfamily)
MKNRNKKVIVFDLDDTLFDSTNQPKDTGGSWDIKIFDNFLPILKSDSFINILVTRGDKDRQNRKIDVLRIRKYFADIHIVDSDTHKYETFITIRDAFLNNEIVVIGNRIDCEIRYGNQLGLKTIHVKHGKYSTLEPRDQYEIPTKTISLDEVVDIKNLL